MAIVADLDGEVLELRRAALQMARVATQRLQHQPGRDDGDHDGDPVEREGVAVEAPLLGHHRLRRGAHLRVIQLRQGSQLAIDRVGRGRDLLVQLTIGAPGLAGGGDVVEAGQEAGNRVVKLGFAGIERRAAIQGEYGVEPRASFGVHGEVALLGGAGQRQKRGAGIGERREAWRGIAGDVHRVDVVAQQRLGNAVLRTKLTTTANIASWTARAPRVRVAVPDVAECVSSPLRLPLSTAAGGVPITIESQNARQPGTPPSFASLVAARRSAAEGARRDTKIQVLLRSASKCSRTERPTTRRASGTRSATRDRARRRVPRWR